MLRKRTKANDPADWFALAEDRMKAADSLWKHEGLTTTGIECLQEAVERYLKGYLIAMGWRLVKTHDLAKLLSDAMAYRAEFATFIPLVDQLTEDFFAQHYPGGDLTHVGDDYEEQRRQVGDLVGLIRQSLPQFFEQQT